MVQKRTAEPASEISKPTIEMYLRTILLVLSWIIAGICSEIIGPTMSVLAHNTHVTFSGIASALAAGSIGGLLTNIFCGVFQNLVNNYQDLLLTMAFFLRAILTSVTPFISSLIVLCLVFFVQGVSGSFANMGGTNLLFKMWETRAAVPFNIVHFGYGCGAICANLLVRPFLSNKKSSVNATMSLQFNSTSSASICAPGDSDIRVPYLITASLCIVLGVGHLIFFIREQRKQRDKAEKQQVDYAPVNTVSSKMAIDSDEMKYSQYSPATYGRGYFGYGLSLSLVFIFYMFFVVGTDQIFVKFYFSYLKFDKFGISTDGASWGVIFFWLSFSIGRLMGAIESVFIPTHICLAIAWCGSLVLAVTWMIYVWILGLTATKLFVLGSLTGFIIAPHYPISFAWINQKLNMTPSLLAALLCGCGLGPSILQKIGGFVMDRDPNHFPTVLVVCIIIAIILYIISNVIIFSHERTLKNKQHPVINDIPLVPKKSGEEEQHTTNYLQGVDEI